MNVAIMGAGLSGLACALTLEKNGIKPTIFESRSEAGDRFVNGETLLPILARPIKDTLAYLADEYGIYLQPVSNIKKLIFYSEHHSASVSGHLGFNNLRGRIEHSFEKQLARQVTSEIIFNSKHSYQDLLKDFTHVIMATGDAAYSARVQQFRTDLTVTLRGATVEGEFDPYTTVVYLNNNYAPMGYSYLIPYSEKEANITIAYPDYPSNLEKDSDQLWSNFYQRLCNDMKQDLRITDKFEVNRYIIGICKYPRIGNTYFIGNCFGAIMPAFGFGQFPAIMTGVYAAQDICGLGDYAKLTKPIRESYKNALVIRRLMEKLDNAKLNWLVRALDTNLGAKFITVEYFNSLKVLSYVLRPLIKV